jgi:hypothetical protein
MFMAVLFIAAACKKDENVQPGNLDSFNISPPVNTTSYRVNKIIQVSDGGYILAGGAIITQDGYYQHLIMKFDKFGNKLWENITTSRNSSIGFNEVFEISTNQYLAWRSFGFADDPYPRAVIYDADGKIISDTKLDAIGGICFLYRNYNYYLAGSVDNNAAFQMVNTLGVSKWIKTFPDSPEIISLTPLPDGSFVAIGVLTYSGQANSLMKLSLSGDTIWTRPISGFMVKGLQDNSTLAIVIDQGKLAFMKISSLGNKTWEKSVNDIPYNSNYNYSVNIFNMDTAYMFTVLNENVLHVFVLNEYGNTLKKTNITLTLPVGHQVTYTKTDDNGLMIVISDAIEQNHDVELLKMRRIF